MWFVERRSACGRTCLAGLYKPVRRASKTVLLYKAGLPPDLKWGEEFIAVQRWSTEAAKVLGRAFGRTDAATTDSLIQVANKWFDRTEAVPMLPRTWAAIVNISLIPKLVYMAAAVEDVTTLKRVDAAVWARLSERTGMPPVRMPGEICYSRAVQGGLGLRSVTEKEARRRIAAWSKACRMADNDTELMDGLGVRWIQSSLRFLGIDPGLGPVQAWLPTAPPTSKPPFPYPLGEGVPVSGGWFFPTPTPVPMSQCEVYTDGSLQGEKAGWAVVAPWGLLLGACQATSSAEAELQAIAAAQRHASLLSDQPFTVNSDSETAIAACQRAAAEPFEKQRSFFAWAACTLAKGPIKLQWVKGHSQNELNDAADAACKWAALHLTPPQWPGPWPAPRKWVPLAGRRPVF
eukprot:TRINITY_DN19416_c0_g1_i1.p1 TRINITY_DN19416_c0_g1~~TRINITY_DN19416_c0_g1_i1.p1  ORF type:complete len:404 (-),score=22.35 TRINITY_DN19416_c0_g1_i1:4-1215(-)